VFMSTRDGNSEIYMMNADGTKQIRLTNDVAADVDPEWSSDGHSVIFDRDVAAGKKKVPQLFMIGADGTQIIQITSLPSSNSHAAWSRVH
jgi:TolB protein